MGVSTRWRWDSQGTAAVLLLAACAVFVPGKVEAGCDHRWLRSVERSSPLDDLALLALGGGQPDLPAERPIPSDRRSPCAHGACSPAPHPQPAGTQTRSEPVNDARGIPTALFTGLATTSQRLALERAHPLPIDLATRIERPPRPFILSGVR
jgi:hypothetical protein